MQIFRGMIQKPLRVVIYGPEGIGKSTFAAQFPAPIFIDTEGSTDYMDVARFPRPSSWTMLLQEIDEARRQTGSFQTLVIDTLDWAEMLCKSHVVSKANVSGIEDFGYGKGYVYVAEEIGKMLDKLAEVHAVGMNIVLTAHAAMRKFEQPDQLGAYDRWELKLEKRDAQMVKEWADMLLFANYEVYAVKTGDEKGAKSKAQGGRRVMFTTHHPCWDAKNRQGLPDKLPFDYGQIAHCITAGAPMDDLPFTFGQSAAPPSAPEIPAPPTQEATAAPQMPAEEPAAPMPSAAPPVPADVPKVVADLMAESGVTEEQLRSVIGQKGYYPVDTPWDVMERDGFVDGWVVACWNNIIEMIQGGSEK